MRSNWSVTGLGTGLDPVTQPIYDTGALICQYSVNEQSENPNRELL